MKTKTKDRTEDTERTEEYKTAIQIRNFEIELLWKRIGYYWAFVAATFVGYGTLNKQEADVFATFAFAHFGLVTTIGWFFFIKASKYWQQHWEQQLADLERKEGLFVRRDVVKCDFGFGPAKYSVSRITMWYSLATCGLWLAIVVHEWAKFLEIPPDGVPRWLQGTVVVVFATGLVLTLVLGTKSRGVVPKSTKQ